MTQPMRRPMSAALQAGSDLPPEALALIKEGTPKPLHSMPVASPVVFAPPMPADVRGPVSPPEPAEATAPIPSAVDETQQLKAPKAKVTRAPEPEPVASNALVSMTFRVPAELPSALVRASADRKAKRLRPFTQQDIVTEALSQWLKRNGNL